MSPNNLMMFLAGTTFGLLYAISPLVGLGLLLLVILWVVTKEDL